MNRRTFINSSALLGAGILLNPPLVFASADYPVVRMPAAKRNFQSKSVENAIAEFSRKVKDKELSWMFQNCFPSTLDTTVTHRIVDGKPDTYVITGDIDAMWLRDSSAQVWPYLPFAPKDEKLKQLIAGVINRQTRCVLKDPYANAFYGDDNKVGEWKSDHTDMKPGVHERKWEIDSLCYPIRLAYQYWKTTNDTSPFGNEWQQAVRLTLATFREQQRKQDPGPYKFQRTTPFATDTLSMSGYGNPVNPVGLICSSFRPSDDATVYSFLVPSNFFAVTSLRQGAEMMGKIAKDQNTSAAMLALAAEVEAALQAHAVIDHPKHGKLYAFEVDGFGSHYLMDDANVPSLLSLPYLGAMETSDPIYQNTRKFILSENNPFYYKGTAGEGVGGPHVGKDMIWPMAIIMRALTSTSTDEIKTCIMMLKSTHGGTGFMHETFHKNDPTKFTRSWFAWANTLFGELLWKTYQENPWLLA
ncbi:glycoside hydrolase family 125 protein [Sabulibacter ruber]|uniref:glycoside hydrolase family 125 protein n=1 Tax=Sabulibacter ruber TaxID=2811901 RepID=UPI001A9771A1|nr:glycoside hydrolase family 125 protein [Sabulibacter ruber]